MTKRILLFSLILTAFVVLGCLTSTTEMFEERLVSPEQPQAISGSTGIFLDVDLRENSTWEEHHEDIDRIERIGFEAEAHSNNEQAAVIEIAYRLDPNDGFTTVLSDLTLSGNETPAAPWILEFGDAEAQLANRESFGRALRDGSFEVRVMTSDPAYDVTILRLDLVVVLSASI